MSKLTSKIHELNLQTNFRANVLTLGRLYSIRTMVKCNQLESKTVQLTKSVNNFTPTIVLRLTNASMIQCEKKLQKIL